MKKYFKKIIMLIVVAFATMSALTVNAEEGMTLTKKTYITYNGRTEAKFYTSKGYGYCITPERTGANQGHNFSFSKYESDGGLAYLLSRGGSDDKTYLITQLAIWKYRSNFMPATFSGTAYGNEAVKLANEASSHKNDSQATTKINLNASGLKVTLTDNGYYQTSYMSATTTASSTYKVEISGVSSAQIINASGNVINSGSTLNSGEKFYVRVPYDKLTTKSTIKVLLSTNGTQTVVKRYSPNNNALQDVVILEKINKNAQVTANINITPTSLTCKYYNGKYYDKNGKITDKTTYKQQCETNICKKVGDKYFGKDGKATDKTTYEQQCETNICKKVGDKYFGKDGKVTDKTTYEQQCETNICKKVGDKYFGKDGKETDEITYEQQCGTNICVKIGDKYFGKDGKETTELKYRQECETNICKQVGDKYYGSTGLEITYEQYKAECETPVDVPDTGTNPTKTIIEIIVGTLIIAGTAVAVKKYNK